MSPVVQNDEHGYWYTSNDFDIVSGRYDEGYAPFSLSKPTNVSVNYDATHQRDIIFAKPNYWVVTDYLDANDLHRFTFLFHLAPDVLVEDMKCSTALLRSGRNGAQLIVAAYSDKEIRSKVIKGSESPIQGWYSEDHYKKCASPVLSFEILESRSAFVTWVLYPIPPGMDAERVKIKITHGDDPDHYEVSVQHADKSDSLSIRNDQRVRLGTARKPESRISVTRNRSASYLDPDES